MKITNVETISFMAKSRAYPSRWGYGTIGDEHEQIQRILKFRQEYRISSVLSQSRDLTPLEQF